MKGNQERKLHPMSKFARKNYCQHAKRNQIQDDKRQLRRAVRRHAKKEIEEGNDTGDNPLDATPQPAMINPNRKEDTP